MNSKLMKIMNYHKLFHVLFLGSFLLICLFGHNLLWAAGEEYPNKPIKMIVPYRPGGVVDLGARFTSDYLAEELKVPVLIENKPGAGGMLGGAQVLKAKRDGYTLLAAGETSLVSGPLQSPNPPYNPFKDFIPICSLGTAPGAFGTYTSSPYKTIGDFVKAAKENPGKISCAITQPGSGTHAMLEMLKTFSGADIKAVPYKGPGDAVAALLGKHVDMGTMTYVGFLRYVKAGGVRYLAVSSAAPDSTIPTLAQAGFPQPEFLTVAGISAFHVPVGTPKPIYEKLVLTFERVAKNPELAKKLDGVGLMRDYNTADELTEFLKKKWLLRADFLEKLGLKKWEGTPW